MLGHLRAHMRVRAMFGADEEMEVHDPSDWPKARPGATPETPGRRAAGSLRPGGVRNEIGRLAAPLASIGLAVSDPLRTQDAQGAGHRVAPFRRRLPFAHGSRAPQCDGWWARLGLNQRPLPCEDHTERYVRGRDRQYASFRSPSPRFRVVESVWAHSFTSFPSSGPSLGPRSSGNWDDDVRRPFRASGQSYRDSQRQPKCPRRPASSMSPQVCRRSCRVACSMPDSRSATFHAVFTEATRWPPASTAHVAPRRSHLRR